jgi:CarD family transcriptional regulator
MFEITDIVIHPTSGICKIEDIREEAFGKLGKHTYYVLSPLYENNHTVIYIPVDGSIELRKVLSKENIKDIIKRVNLNNQLWIENDHKRAEKFNNILRSGNQSQIIELIVEIYMKQEEKAKEGKKLHVSDIRILDEAQKMVHQEFAYALNIELDKIGKYIMKELHITSSL